MSAYFELRKAVADGNQALAVAGHTDMVWGHASVRDPGGSGVWMKAAGWGFDEISPDEEHVVHVSDTGDVLNGTGKRHIEFYIHTELLAARPELGAVVHTHSVPAATFASLETPLRPVTHYATPFLEPGGDIPRFTATSDLISTPELGQQLAEAIGSANGVLIPGHGIVTVGKSIAHAVMFAVMLDRACYAQLEALAAGGPATWSSDEDVASKRRMWEGDQSVLGYEYLVRQAEKARR